MVVHFKKDAYYIYYNTHIGRLSLYSELTGDRRLYFYNIDKIYIRKEDEVKWTRIYKKDITFNLWNGRRNQKWEEVEEKHLFNAEISFSIVPKYLSVLWAETEKLLNYYEDMDIKDFINKTTLEKTIKNELSAMVNE